MIHIHILEIDGDVKLLVISDDEDIEWSNYIDLNESKLTQG